MPRYPENANPHLFPTFLGLQLPLPLAQVEAILKPKPYANPCPESGPGTVVFESARTELYIQSKAPDISPDSPGIIIPT